ncbi:hypothetical protein PSEUBRA_001186 [Kalmanozyma brasiliensis GHG001]|uniref:Uncharacterized protein n=1 Tax=Kalmanozyma brasiliensis (strain GHG001) TaxID=1365824 RepID=V5GTJ0_KALBG|nr:uncharacterized protein PSEUBRA_001186 [Kalmanozyma brasiliensis GHG001]EST09232.1 hypothetical protein PSEUBRA_001186 [Kalmanozyma brasiliensis GHG001]
MRQRTPSSNDGYSSSSSTSPARQRAYTPRSPPRSRTRPSPDEPTLTGSIGKLVRLAIFAVLLALIVPFVRTRLFGSSPNPAKNATVDVSVRPTAFPSQEVFTSGDEEVDVFNFKHEDYLAPARAAKKAGGVSSKPSSSVPPKTKTKKQESKGKVSKAPKKQPRVQHDDDEEDDERDSPASSALSTLTHLFFTLYHLTRATLYLTIIPFSHIFRLGARLTSTSYHYFRLSLSHTLLPVFHLLAPLTYLVSGIFFVFVQTPFNLVSAIVTELYPVYIFLGAATVVGLSMGVVAAGVLYLSAFMFVDRVQKVDDVGGGTRFERIKAPGGHGKGKGRMVEEDDDEDVFGGIRTNSSNGSTPTYGRGGKGTSAYDQYLYQNQPQRREYFNQPHSSQGGQGAYASPMLSPTAPFRNSNVRRHGGRNDHAYRATSASTLRAGG